MSVSDEFLEKYLTKWEFRKSYPDLVVRLIERSRDTAKELYSSYNTIKKYIAKKIDDCIDYIHVLESDDKNKYDGPMGSVDGSMTTIKGFGDRWFVVYGVSIVIFLEGARSFARPKIDVDVNNEFIHGNDPTEIKREAILRMMTGESKAIRRLANEYFSGGVVFIDGPIIDPPTIKDNDYIAYRMESFRHNISSGNYIIGVVKRYSSRLFIGSVFGNDKNIPVQNDRIFIPILFNLYRTRFSINPDQTLYTTPFRLREDLELAIKPEVFRLYEESLASRGNMYIYGMYLQYKLGVRTLKIEFFAHNDFDAKRKAKEIVGLLREAMVPGTYLPLPIILAHETSLIRKRVARALFSNAISQFVSEVSDYNIIYDLITYE